jgi:adenine-specific DNA-methyltransferase
MENISPRHPAKLPEDIRQWAKEMRGNMTDAEALLWKLLRGRRMASAKFRRQHPLGRYILDFYCEEKKLCLEIDGSQHMDAAEYDERRDTWLASQKIRVLRFWSNQVLSETESVLEAIYAVLMTEDLAIPLIPGPSPACGRRENKS